MTNLSMDEALKILDSPDKLPISRETMVSALQVAREHKQEITPRLLEYVKQAIEEMRAGNVVSTMGHFNGLYLLAEFQEPELRPCLGELLQLPGDGVYELFGDASHEELIQVMAFYLGDSLDQLDECLSNELVEDLFRGSLAEIYKLLVRDGKLTRADAVKRLGDLFVRKLEVQRKKPSKDRCSVFLSCLACKLCDLSPVEYQEPLEAAFRDDCIDTGFIGRREILESIANPQKALDNLRDRTRATGIADCTSFLPGYNVNFWGEDQLEDKEDVEEDDWSLDIADVAEPAITIFRETERVGRNEPRTCGSGRKYKKCCGAQ
ncbi:MAG: DUF1186 domain-containing protein [Planctomycetaceae bacterium]|nr:DUF1186 domain-containing protein [Planctomycetaceae bacterium]